MAPKQRDASFDNGRHRVDRPFPRRTIEDALRIPQAIREKNGGNPYAPGQIAAAIRMGPKTGSYFYVTAAARDYGLTTGTRDSDEIALTGLGRRAVYPENPEDRDRALQEAFFSVDLFRRVLEHYQGLNLPEKEFLDNTLTTKFGLAAEVHSEFVDLLEKNCRFLGIGSSLPAGGARKPASGLEVKHKAPHGDIETLTRSSDASERPVCFVIMPFKERDERHSPGFFNEVLESLVRPAAERAGFQVKTANRRGSDIIQSTIVNELLDADLVVADLTEHNPNVLFELGLRMAEEKPVALVRAKDTGRIFDVDNMLRVEDYDPCLWPSTVKTDLPKLAQHIQATWEQRTSGLHYIALLRQHAPAQ